jgi:arylformamidase
MAMGSVWLDLDQEGLDAAYDNQRHVADYAALMDEWNAASDRARRACKVIPDIAYGAHPRARFDFYPAGRACPLLVFFHGGFWRTFDKAGLAFLAPPFVEAGISIALPNYPLAPEANLGMIVDHARRATEWLVRHASELDIDRSRLWVGGHSAGAHLALMVLLTSWRRHFQGLPANPIAGCCAISGIYDLEPVRRSYLNRTLDLSPQDVAELSPIGLIPRQAVPLMLACGTHETSEFRRQTHVFGERWCAASLPLLRRTIDGADHYEAVRSIGRAGGLFEPLVAAIRQRDGGSG